MASVIARERIDRTVGIALAVVGAALCAASCSSPSSIEPRTAELTSEEGCNATAPRFVYARSVQSYGRSAPSSVMSDRGAMELSFIERDVETSGAPTYRSDWAPIAKWALAFGLFVVGASMLRVKGRDRLVALGVAAAMVLAVVVLLLSLSSRFVIDNATDRVLVVEVDGEPLRVPARSFVSYDSRALSLDVVVRDGTRVIERGTLRADDGLFGHAARLLVAHADSIHLYAVCGANRYRLDTRHYRAR